MPKENVPNGVPYVRVKDMTADGINVAGLRRTSTVIAEAYRRSMLRSGDVLVSIRGTYGRVAIVPAQLDGANVTQDTARVAPSAAVLAAYLAGVLRAPEAQAYMRRVARGVAVKGVNLGDLKVLPIPLPPLESQEQLMGAVQEQVDRIVRFDAVVTIALRRARLLRQSILKAAFTGRLVKRPVVNQTDGVPKTGFVVTHARVTQ
jgi:type I restriction enzyme S subunit